eukprot:5691037-Amphidinium_carterae.1
MVSKESESQPVSLVCLVGLASLEVLGTSTDSVFSAKGDGLLAYPERSKNISQVFHPQSKTR